MTGSAGRADRFSAISFFFVNSGGVQGGKRAGLRSDGRAGGFMLEGFWRKRGVPRGSSDESGFEVDFKWFWRGLGAQVGSKLGPSWLQNGRKSEKNRFFGGSDLNFMF